MIAGWDHRDKDNQRLEGEINEVKSAVEALKTEISSISAMFELALTEDGAKSWEQKMQGLDKKTAMFLLKTERFREEVPMGEAGYTMRAKIDEILMPIIQCTSKLAQMNELMRRRDDGPVEQGEFLSWGGGNLLNWLKQVQRGDLIISDSGTVRQVLKVDNGQIMMRRFRDPRHQNEEPQQDHTATWASLIMGAKHIASILRRKITTS